ncbi:MAG: hypothetical protein MJZ94_12005, partial [Bacteroidales bacterium]|nr:hypothetical protein [Bacteroidales bacterium]
MLQKIVVTDAAVLVEHPLIDNLSDLMEFLVIDDTQIRLLDIQFKINPSIISLVCRKRIGRVRLMEDGTALPDIYCVPCKTVYCCNGPDELLGSLAAMVLL